MSVKVRSKSQRIAILDRVGYIARPQRYSNIKSEDVLKYAAQSSNVPIASIRNTILAMQNAIIYFVVNGHTVNLGRFGKLTPTCTCKAADVAEQCSVDLVKSIKCKYTPSAEMKKIVANVKLSNTVEN